MSSLAALCAAALLSGCGGESDSLVTVGSAQQALTARPARAPAGSCGYQVTTGTYTTWPNGYQAYVNVKNVSGATATDFSVFLDLGESRLVDGYLAEYEAVEGGYLATAPSWLKWQRIPVGSTYQFQFIGEGKFDVTPYVISINGVVCDTKSPEVLLTLSADFFTADDTLTLTADASDNATIRKVVFAQDGKVIGTDSEAPYTLDVAVTSALNGRHTYTATAYDYSNNSAADTDSALVAIGNKFFGTAVAYSADYAQLLDYFNQLTPGNAGKWGSVEATRNEMEWADLDAAYTFASTNGLPFKFHTLVWGQQQPGWLSSLSLAEQRQEIEEWFDAVAERYPDIDLIDVVNEPLHSAPSYKEALGGDGETGWDWVIAAFELARQHFPKSELILNEYSVIQDAQTTENYVALIDLLKERDLIDGIGEQGHFYERWPELDVLSADLDTLAATGLPIYISELDVNDPNDSCQAARLSELFTLFWEHPAVVGVTHWGYLKGLMWRSEAWLVDGTIPRTSLDWIQCYRAGGSCEPVACVPRHEGNSAGITLQPELYDDAEGLRPVGDAVGYAGDGSWFAFHNVVFDSNWNVASLSYAKPGTDPVSMTVHLDSLDNPPVATLELGDSGGWWQFATVESVLPPVSGTHDVYVRYNGGGANVENVQFSNASGNLLPDSGFEDGQDGWYGTDSTAEVVNGWSHTGEYSLQGFYGGTVPPYPALWRDIKTIVEPGKKYQASAWLSVNTSGGSGIYIGWRGQFGCANGQQWDGALHAEWIGNDTWVHWTGEIDLTPCDQVWWANLYASWADSGFAYVDDVELTEIE